MPQVLGPLEPGEHGARAVVAAHRLLRKLLFNWAHELAKGRICTCCAMLLLLLLLLLLVLLARPACRKGMLVLLLMALLLLLCRC
jgi:hypothetical protein